MGKIAIYKGLFQYDAVNVFAEEIGRGFEALGKEIVYIDLTDQEHLAANIGNAISGSCEFVLSFGAVGHCIKTSDGRLLHEQLPFPFVAVLVDHPAHFIDRLNITNIIVACIDRTHVEYLNHCFHGDKKIAFLPHGGCSAGAPVPSKEKSIDILFPGTYMDQNESLQHIKMLGGSIQKWAFAALDLVLSRNNLPFEKALQKSGKELGIDLSDSNAYIGIAPIVSAIENMTRAIRRDKILSLLDENGISVNIFGNNWPDGLFKNHKVSPAKPFSEILGLMQKSKIVMNVGIYPNGSHERVFSAMLNGTAVLSDCNPYLSEVFEEDKDIAFYRWRELEKVPETINDLLSDSDKRQKMAKAGKEKAEKSHTWKSRAESVLKLVKDL